MRARASSGAFGCTTLSAADDNASRTCDHRDSSLLVHLVRCGVAMRHSKGDVWRCAGGERGEWSRNLNRDRLHCGVRYSYSFVARLVINHTFSVPYNRLDPYNGRSDCHTVPVSSLIPVNTAVIRYDPKPYAHRVVYGRTRIRYGRHP